MHSIARIAALADTDLSLTRRAIQHLVYYGCLVLLDIFSFGAIYAPTAEIGGFVIDPDVKDECARYIRVPRLRIPSISTATLEHPSSSPPPPSNSTDQEKNEEWSITHTTLIHLYTSLRQGLPLKSWALANIAHLPGIDVRRLITFGILKGFVYRVHKYAIGSTSAGAVAPPTSLATSTREEVGGGAGEGAGVQNALPMLRFLDGLCCFDQMCTELGVPERVVEGRVRGMGEGLGVIVQR